MYIGYWVAMHRLGNLFQDILLYCILSSDNIEYFDIKFVC